MAEQLNRALCQKLWERYRDSEITEKCFRVTPRDEQDSKTGKASFLGYVDLDWIDDLGFKIKFRSLEAKVLKGQVYLDFPSEKSNKKDENGDPIYYPRMLTKTAESRDVMTMIVFRDKRVAAEAKAAQARWAKRQEGAASEPGDDAAGAEDGEFSDDNPFARE